VSSLWTGRQSHSCCRRTWQFSGTNHDCGEAPGQNESNGVAICGKAGQLLEKKSVKLVPEQDIYIANVIKCRPPANRVPTTEEVAACKPYLLEQIRLVDPKIIL